MTVSLYQDRASCDLNTFETVSQAYRPSRWNRCTQCSVYLVSILMFETTWWLAGPRDVQPWRRRAQLDAWTWRLLQHALAQRHRTRRDTHRRHSRWRTRPRGQGPRWRTPQCRRSHQRYHGTGDTIFWKKNPHNQGLRQVFVIIVLVLLIHLMASFFFNLVLESISLLG